MNGLIANAMNYGAKPADPYIINFGGANFTPNRLERIFEWLDRQIIDTITTVDNRFDIILSNYTIKPEVESNLKAFKFDEFYSIFDVGGSYGWNITYDRDKRDRIKNAYMTPKKSLNVDFPNIVIEALHKESNSSIILSTVYGFGSVRLEMSENLWEDKENDMYLTSFFPNYLSIEKVIPKKMSITIDTEYIFGGLPVIKFIPEEDSIEENTELYCIIDEDTGSGFKWHVSDNSHSNIRSNPNIVVSPFSGYSTARDFFFGSDVYIDHIRYFLNALWKSVFKTIGLYDNKLFMEG